MKHSYVSNIGPDLLANLAEPFDLQSELLEGGFFWHYIGEYYRG